MKKRVLFIVWGWLYLLCAALGHIQSPAGIQAASLTALSVAFFIPGFWLLLDAWKQKDKKTCQLLCHISLTSLVLTVVFLLANIFSATGSKTLGDVLYVFLIWVSAPMVCSQFWVLILFLWSILFFAARACKKKL